MSGGNGTGGGDRAAADGLPLPLEAVGERLDVIQKVRHPQRRAFARAYALTAHKGRAAAAAGVDRTTPYTPAWREDEEFQAAMTVAQQIAGDLLEEEARRRAVDGLVRYKHDKDGNPLRHPDRCDCGHGRRDHVEGERGRGACRGCSCETFRPAPYYELEYSDGLMSLLLKGAKPNRYATRVESRSLLASIDLARLPDALLERIAAGEHPQAVLASYLDGADSPALPQGRDVSDASGEAGA